MGAVNSQASHPCHQCQVQEPLVSSPQGNARPHRAWLCSPGTHPSTPPSLSSQPSLCRQTEHDLTIITAYTTHICLLLHGLALKHSFLATASSKTANGPTLTPHSFAWAGREVNILQVDLWLATCCCFPLSWKPSFSVALLSTHFLRGSSFREGTLTSFTGLRSGLLGAM